MWEVFSNGHQVKLRTTLKRWTGLILRAMAPNDFDAVLHLGLPKTGTTSLQQHLFPILDKFNFLGVRQPRTLEQGEVFVLLRQYVLRGKGNLDHLRQQLKMERAKGLPLLFSEEEVLIGRSDGAEPATAMTMSWKDKVSRLADAFEGMDVQVVVALRDFRQGVFSYYTELHPSIGPSVDPVELVRSSDLFGIWRFEELEATLTSHFGKALRWTSFPACMAPEALEEVWGADEVVPLPNTNTKKKSAHHVVQFESTGLLLELSRKTSVLPVKKGLRRLHEVGFDWQWRRKQIVKRWSEEIWGELADVEKQSNSTMAKLLEPPSAP